MKVKIFNYTPNAEKVCSAAGRMSTTAGTCSEVYDSVSDIFDARKTLSRITKLGHTSILEHSYFNIMFENVSLFFEQFLIEHRLSAYTIKSGRYVDFRGVGCYEPNFRFKNDVSDEIKKDVKDKYINFIDKSFSLYEELADSGIKVEDARFVLPYSLKTNIYCSMNGRELLHLIWACLYGRGKNYPEIVDIGNNLKEDLKEIAPSLAENLEQIERGTENKEDKLNALLGMPIYKKEEDKSEKPIVELIDITANPEKVIAISAIVKNKQWSIKEAEEILNSNPGMLDKILDIVFEDKRPRELEQVNITFRMNDMPLILLKHQTRHRIQNINIPSFTEMIHTTRYTIPPSIIEKGEEYKLKCEEIYKEANNLHDELYKIGVFPEDLVYLYLHSKNIDFITTINARALYHITQLRTCNRAQWKMREYYRALLKELLLVSPKIFKHFGPNCYTKGYCPEGKLTCGEMNFVKEDFAWLVSSIEK